jgi:hypothetical protein
MTRTAGRQSTLHDTDCRSVIYAAKPNLLVYFDREVHGSRKADICRVAALYLTGSYYFDADMEALEVYQCRNLVSSVESLLPTKSLQCSCQEEDESCRASRNDLATYSKRRMREGINRERTAIIEEVKVLRGLD